MVVVQVREKNMVHFCGVDVGLDHGARGVGAAIKQIVPPTDGKQDT